MTEEDKKFCVAHEWIGYDAQYRIITHQTDADLSHLERCNKDSMGAPLWGPCVNAQSIAQAEIERLVIGAQEKEIPKIIHRWEDPHGGSYRIVRTSHVTGDIILEYEDQDRVGDAVWRAVIDVRPVLDEVLFLSQKRQK